MYHLVLDLEMCRVPKHYRSKNYKYAHEIIQIGAVLMDEEFEIIGQLNQFVHPVHGVLDFFISDLTGIESNQLKNAPLLEEALEHLIAWLGDREYKIYQWSNSDHKQLIHEIKSKGIESETIELFMNAERWVDYQAVFGKRYDFSRAVSLNETLMCCNIKIDGRLHDGLSDAVNTAKIIKLLETEKDFKLYEYEKENVEESPGLNFCLGDLFAGLQFECFA